MTACEVCQRFWQCLGMNVHLELCCLDGPACGSAGAGAPSSTCYPSKPRWLGVLCSTSLWQRSLQGGMFTEAMAITNLVAQTIMSGVFIGESMQPVPVRVVEHI